MTRYYLISSTRGTYFTTAHTRELSVEIDSIVKKYKRNIDAGWTMSADSDYKKLERALSKFDRGTIEHSSLNNAINDCDDYRRYSHRSETQRSRTTVVVRRPAPIQVKIESPRSTAGKVALGFGIALGVGLFVAACCDSE
jgi:hypothetical protein